MNERGQLGKFLAEVIHWRWDEFVKAEKNPKYTGLEAAVLSLVRTCSEAKLGPIKLAIDRVDGKIETPIKIEYPKVFFIYPEAETVALAPTDEQISGELEAGAALAIPDDPPADIPEEEPVSAATLTLRQTLRKMAETQREVVPLVLQKKKEVELALKQDIDYDIEYAPLVKSVIAANLLHLAIEKNNFDAITEIFDQIDGKLVETIRILGDDIYVKQFSLEAPYGAVKNKEGKYILEATAVQELWKQKLKKS